jgi:hypothetical protein
LCRALALLLAVQQMTGLSVGIGILDLPLLKYDFLPNP